MAGRTTRSDSSMAIDALKDAEVGSIPYVAGCCLYHFYLLVPCICTLFFCGTVFVDEAFRFLKHVFSGAL